MNREILFRAKRKDNGEWAYGDLEHNGKNVPKWVNGNEIVPESVGQFTGLTDKNGKKIFGGDIISFRDEQSGEAIPTCKTLLEYIEKEKRNAVKEFAEKLKEKFDDYGATSYNGYEEEFHDLQEEIDELLKEYEK